MNVLHSERQEFLVHWRVFIRKSVSKFYILCYSHLLSVSVMPLCVG